MCADVSEDGLRNRRQARPRRYLTGAFQQMERVATDPADGQQAIEQHQAPKLAWFSLDRNVFRNIAPA